MLVLALEIFEKNYQKHFDIFFQVVEGGVADPEFFHPGSRIQGQKDSGSRISIRIKEFKYF